MPTLMLWWSNITLGQQKFTMHKTGGITDFCLASIPHLKLNPPWLCHVNKHFPWLCMWSTVKCPTSQGVTPTFSRVNNCIWVHESSKTSCQHFAYPAGPKPEKQHADHAAQTRKQSIHPPIYSRGPMLPSPARWTWGIPAQHILPVSAFPTWVLTQRENAGWEHLSANSRETGPAHEAERARLQLTPSTAGATTEDGHWLCTTNVSCESSRNSCP